MNQEKKTPGLPEFVGNLVMTRAIAHQLDENAEFARRVSLALAKYCAENWGAISDDDAQANDDALQSGDLMRGAGRIVARYHTEGPDDNAEEFRDGDIYIISQMDETDVYTCVLFPDEY